MSSIKEYFSSVGQGIASLAKGMAVTGKELVTPKITEQYPENRKTLKIADRFRAELTLIGDDATPAYNKCIACGICQMNCPNSSIELKTRFVELPDGKKKKVLDKYYYDLGSCTFCMLCVTTCPQDALEFSNEFEQAVFTRDKLVKQLNAHSEMTDSQVIAEASKPKPKPAMDPEQLAKIKAEALAKAAALKAQKEGAQVSQPNAPENQASK
ncbi:MAG: 4Fe-4S dicluster domain-containing protein [Muribaculaceae bacterium]|nr:4Fe-4S dicluster domain-containing protein [Muribaculaceae bacterium]